MIFWFFGINSKENKILLTEILKDTDETFLKWAIDKIVTWKNQTIIENIFHIHGSHDRLLPKRYIKSNITIEKGGHLITLSKADDINRILRKEI